MIICSEMCMLGCQAVFMMLVHLPTPNCSRTTNKEILNGDHVTVSDVNILPFLVGDSAYPLSMWLMKPFPYGSDLTHGQKQFYRILKPSGPVVC